MRIAYRHMDTSEIPRYKRFVLIRKDTAHPQSARTGTNLIVDEVDGSSMRESLFVSNSKRNWYFHVARVFSASFTDHLLHVLDRVLIHIEIGIDRIHRHDRGQKCAAPTLSRLDQIARAYLVST